MSYEFLWTSLYFIIWGFYFSRNKNLIEAPMYCMFVIFNLRPSCDIHFGQSNHKFKYVRLKCIKARYGGELRHEISTHAQLGFSSQELNVLAIRLQLIAARRPDAFLWIRPSEIFRFCWKLFVVFHPTTRVPPNYSIILGTLQLFLLNSFFFFFPRM